MGGCGGEVEGYLACLTTGCPLSAIPTANYLLMSSLSRVDSLHHHH